MGAGAFVDPAGVATFRVWAPAARTVELVVHDSELRLPLRPATCGYFEMTTDGLSADTLYMYRVDGQGPFPDPCSRFQPQGPHGPSQLVGPHRFCWDDDAWRGVDPAGQVLYELHIGAFTPDGTFDAACERLQWLKQLGVTLIELMPVAEFPGRWNWGYDGVQLFAPFHGYGDYEGLKRFVSAAHRLGLGVILDVVYNHLGPDGNYLRCFSPHYFHATHATEWGEPLNFDGEHCNGARDLVIDNAAYWIREFHLDGLRLDATQAIFDDSDPHVLAALTTRARTAAEPRAIVVFAENEPQLSHHVDSTDTGGFGIDGMWNDDFHHAARVALTGSRDGYYYDYTGRAQELLSAVRHGFLFQGQFYHWQKRRRGSPLRDKPAWTCVHFLQNHDQVGNSPGAHRPHLLGDPARYRAQTALLLLGPQTPLLFMGQEFFCSRPFHYFADHTGELAQQVWQGRREFMRQFCSMAGAAAQHDIPDPASLEAFETSKLDWSEAEAHREAVQLHEDLLRLRREDPVISRQDRSAMEGATLSEHAFVLRWYDEGHGDRLLVINLHQGTEVTPMPEPLLAPARDCRWALVWSSQDVRYGGSGATSPVDEQQRWQFAADTAVLLRQEPVSVAG